ncbi:MAG: hypothetical protein C4538_02080 [Nitrospiraceae bacterium]|nr:MAG: hypothetical protein C4538_02080 [Nitrospiraceae bacterium]
MGYIKIITAILIWSSLGIFVRNIGLPDNVIVFYTSCIAGLLQISLLVLTGQLKKNISASDGIHRTMLYIGLPVCSLVNLLLFYFAFRNTTIASAVLSHYTAPIFVAVLAPLLLKEKSHKAIWIAIMLSSLGLWLMLWLPSSGAEASPGNNDRAGIIAGALSGFSYALIVLIIRSLASRYTALFVIAVQNSVMAILLFPFALQTPLTSQSLLYLVLMALLHSTIAPLIYVQGFKSVKANEAAILGYFEPVGAAILAFIFLKEAPGGTALLGGALILYSGYLALKNRDR